MTKIFKNYVIFAIKLIIVYVLTDLVGNGIHIVTGILEGQHGAPSFLTPAFSYYSIVTKILLLIGFLLMANLIPVKGGLKKGLLFFLLFWAAAYLPQMLAMLGGRSAYLEPEAFSIATIIKDSAGDLVKGFFLGLFIAKKEKPELRPIPKKTMVIACISSALLFSMVLLVIELIAGAIWPSLLMVNICEIMSEDRVSFYIVFYISQALSGFITPLFYRYTIYNNRQSWFKFANIYAWCLWLPIILIMILFGTNVVTTIVWALFMVATLYLDIFVFAGIMKRAEPCKEG